MSSAEINKEGRLKGLCASGKIIGTRHDSCSLEILGLMSSDACQVFEWLPCPFSSRCWYLMLRSLLGFLLSHLLPTLPYTPVLFLPLGATLPQIHDHTSLVPLDGLLRTPTHTKCNNCPLPGDTRLVKGKSGAFLLYILLLCGWYPWDMGRILNKTGYVSRYSCCSFDIHQYFKIIG